MEDMNNPVDTGTQNSLSDTPIQPTETNNLEDFTEGLDEVGSELEQGIDDEIANNFDNSNADVSYYTNEELAKLQAENLPIDDNRIPPAFKQYIETFKKSLQGDYTKKTQELARERKELAKTREELTSKLKAYKEEQDKKYAENISNSLDVTQEEQDAIFHGSIENFKQIYGLDYDNSNMEHKRALADIFNKSYVNLSNHKKQQAFQVKLNNTFKDVNINELDERAGAFLRKMSVEDAEMIKQAYIQGDFDEVLNVYNIVYQEMIGSKVSNQNQLTNHNQPQIKQIPMPPQTISKNNGVKGSTVQKNIYNLIDGAM